MIVAKDAPYHGLGDSAPQDIHKRVGMSLSEPARWLEMSSLGVGFSVKRGEAVARENGYRLFNSFLLIYHRYSAYIYF